MKAPDEKSLSRFGWSDRKEVRIPGRMMRSKAYIDLSNTAKFVLMLFMHRRTWYKEGKGKKTKRIYENRNLMFTYREARELWGINGRTFRDCIEQLISHGFIRVQEQGGTLQGERVSSLYMLVDDWQYYGTSRFIKPEIPKTLCFNDNLKRINEARKGKFSHEVYLTERMSPTSPEGPEMEI